MTYKPKLNPKRGFMIEKFITRQDVEQAKMILKENDELVWAVGSANYDHQKGMMLTAGERIDLIDFTLQAEGLDPNRYMIVPIEDYIENSRWIADTCELAPKWHTIYTRNFKNATEFRTYQRKYGYNIQTIKEQRHEEEGFDHYGLIAKHLAGNKAALKELNVYVPNAVIDRIMQQQNLVERIDTEYNRAEHDFNKEIEILNDRILFLGRLNPLTGNWNDSTGHIANFKYILEEEKKHLIIAIGSASKSDRDNNPLSGGKRYDLARYLLQAKGIDASQFTIVPVRDISADTAYANKVISVCPPFKGILAGNDVTLRLFGKGAYEQWPVKRNKNPKTGEEISASLVRKITTTTIRESHTREELEQQEIPLDTRRKIERNLKGYVDPAALKKLPFVEFYETMKFLTFKIE